MACPNERATLPTDKGRDHSRPLRFSAWRRYQVRRDISSFSQGFLASIVLARSSIRGRPFLAGRLIWRPQTFGWLQDGSDIF